jgi:hypothetical protein
MAILHFLGTTTKAIVRFGPFQKLLREIDGTTAHPAVLAVRTPIEDRLERKKLIVLTLYRELEA